MSTIIPIYRTIEALLQNQSFSIDEYQREYKWDKENVEELLEDLVAKFRSSYRKGDATKKVAGYQDYFLGSIIVTKRDVENLLIDGQQRVTTLTLLLIYLYHAAREKKLDVVNSLAPLIYSDNFGSPSFNLTVPERRPVIEALFNGEPFVTEGKEESLQTMYARYGDIEASDLTEDLGEALLHFIYWIMKKVGLIEIATDNDGYAYEIFETMNDRGKSLSPMDMLKAWLLALVDDADQRRGANEVWKQQVLSLISWSGEQEPERDASCVKAWLRAQYAESIRDRKAGAKDKDWELIGSSFHRWVRDKKQELQLTSAEQNLALMRNDFPFFVSAYLTILNAGRTYTPGLRAVFYNAHNEFTWQNTVLLAPLRPSDDADTTRRKLEATATYLDIWLMRRTVNYIRVGYSSTSYAMYNLCKDIRRKPLADLIEILTRKLDEDDVTFDGCPTRGRGGLKELGLNRFTGRYIYHLLARLTAFVEAGSGQADLFNWYVDRRRKNPMDIEHVWANDFSRYEAEFRDESEFQDWRNHIAGLLLLPADVNRSLQGMPYEQKAKHYAKQNLYAASLTALQYQYQPQFEAFRSRNHLPMQSYVTFGRAEQTERRELLRELVHLVWSPERLKDVLL